MPPIYAKYFYNLHDKAKPINYNIVNNIIIEELGKDPKEFFEHFDEEPTASASIA